MTNVHSARAFIGLIITACADGRSMASSASVSGCLSSVSATSLQSRPFYVQGMENDPEDIFDVVSVGPPFQYVIPSFDVLAVELRLK